MAIKSDCHIQLDTYRDLNEYPSPNEHPSTNEYPSSSFDKYARTSDTGPNRYSWIVRCLCDYWGEFGADWINPGALQDVLLIA